MALTTGEALAKLPEVLAFLMKMQEEINKLPQPPAPRNAEAYGILVAAVAPDLGRLIDSIQKEIED